MNSGLLEKLDISELTFVIGHELAHIYYEHSYIVNAFKFIYDDESKKPPPLLDNYFQYWNKLTELSSDRLALFLVNDFDITIRFLFKICSGLSSQHIKIKTENILKFAKDNFEKLKYEESKIYFSHPSNFLRILLLKNFIKKFF